VISLLTNIYLVRHAHSLYTPDELGRPLSANGILDAERVSSILEYENIDIILSSPYKRAIQTVEGIAGIRGKEIIIVDSFKERTLSLEPVEDFNIAITKVWEDSSFSWPGGESNIKAQKRGIQAIENVVNTYEGKNIVIGTHGNLMVLIMNYFDVKYGFEFWKTLDMTDVYRLTFDNEHLQEMKRIWKRT